MAIMKYRQVCFGGEQNQAIVLLFLGFKYALDKFPSFNKGISPTNNLKSLFMNF
jgi:hypothetical protein